MDGSSKRITQCCAEAATGYMAAATAAYTELASCALDFWCTALSGLAEEETKPEPRACPVAEPAFGMAIADWNPLMWFDPRRFDALWRLDFMTPPATAMLAVANTALPLRGTSASWPMAKVMIDSGIPRSVAWPTAEANAAALSAADTAANGLRRVLAKFHNDNSFGSSTQNMTPTMMALALTCGAALGPARMMGDWS